MLARGGAVVTDTGLTFSIAPVNPLAQPFRLRCTSCPWQATVTGPNEIRQQTDRHAGAHELNPTPSITHRPGWIRRRKGNM
jgi:hypothetical protein